MHQFCVICCPLKIEDSPFLPVDFIYVMLVVLV